MNTIDYGSLFEIMELYSDKEILETMIKISLEQASNKSDLELHDAAKEASNRAFVLTNLLKILNS